MEVEEKTLGPLPVLAAGNGEPLFYLGGLLPTAGVDSSLARRSAEASARPFIDMRTVIYVNRRSGLTNGTTIAEIAAEHAAAIGALNCGPVDVLGASTGGSIAQQFAADHPETVRRLALVAIGCRLSANARRMQARVAQQVRAGKRQEALASMIVGVIAPGAAPLARVLAPFVSPLVRRVGDLSDLAATIEAEDRFDLARCQGTIAAPTLIVAGARDRIYPPSLREGDTATDPWKRPGDDPQTRAPDSHERPTPRSNGAGVPAASAVEGCLARKARSASGRILASPAGAKQLATNLGRTVRVAAGFAGLGRGRTGSARSTCPTLGRARLMTQAAGAGRSQSRPSRALISARDE